MKQVNGGLTVTDTLITFSYAVGYPGYPNYPAQYVAYFDKIDLTPFKNIHIKYSAARSHWSSGTDARIAIHNNNTDDPKKPIVFEHLLGLVTDKVDYNKISTYVSWKEKDIDITDITGEKYIALVLGNINDTAAYDIKWRTYLKIESMTLS